MGEPFFNDPFIKAQNSISIFSIVFAVFFILFFIVIAVIIFQKLRENSRNNASPVLTVDATLTSKRINVTQHGDANSSSGSTFYYATFSVPSGDRIEFSISGKQYGILAERDIGKLTFQGTRFLNFNFNKDIYNPQ